jgi:spermidine synthase
LIIGVLFMPAFGTKWSLAAVALGYMALLTDYASVKRFALIIPFGCLLLLPGDLRLVRTFEGQRVIAYREGVMASVAVIENQQKHRFLRVNNRYQMGGTSPSAIRFQLRQGHIPLLLHSNPRRALFLGVGTGITPLAAADHPGLQTDAVELVPEVVQALPAFSLDGDDLISANSIRVHVADARRFVKTTDNKYDVIVADLFHPARDGGGMLYTREHFQAIKQRLSPDGLFCQWLPAYQLDHDTLKLITRTFLEVYPDARVVMADVDLNYPAVGLVAVNGDWPNYHSRWLEDRASAPALKDKLQAIDLKGSIGLFGLGIGDASDLRSYAGEGVVNTDNRPLVVYRAPRFAVQQNQTSYGRLIDLIQTIGVNSTMWTAVEGPFEEALGNWIGRRNEALDQAIKK